MKIGSIHKNPTDIDLNLLNNITSTSTNKKLSMKYELIYMSKFKRISWI